MANIKIERPEYVTCVRRTDNKTWCGRDPGFDFTFVSIDHAAENGLQQGRLVACPECVEAILIALSNGTE